METLNPPDHDSREEQTAALTLCDVPGLGPVRIRHLIDRHGSARAALKALGRVPASDYPGPTRGRLVTYGSAGYPARLTRLHDPPIILWIEGPLPVDAARSVAIVGTRRATGGGRAIARRIASDLAAAGVRIVSGLARGIDAAAHAGALEANGETVGVLGSGLDFEYPGASRSLYGKLRARGALLTEFAPDVPPRPHQFPRRNRIVAALSDAVLVVQAGERSGASITAAHAADVGVEVLACPGAIGLAVSAGCHALLRDGAGVVTCAGDVMEALAWPAAMQTGDVSHGAQVAAGAHSRVVLERLCEGQASLEQLARLVGSPAGALAAVGELEALGMVRSGSGAQFEVAK